MIYRKSPPSPPRLLLRVVATAGAGALLGAVACSSSSFNGTVPSADASDDAAFELDAVATGVLPGHPDATMLACGGGACGIMAEPDDAGADACTGPDCGVPGVIDAGPKEADGASPGDASDAATGPCHPFCGVVVRPDE
jgi:hypothetical protein